MQPGDRIIAKVHENYTDREMKKIKKMVQRWAGADVEVLVVNALRMEVIVDRRG